MFRHLCSFTHPDIAQVPDVPQQYRGIKALKEALKSHLQRHFCDVCLEGRKVWIDKHRRKYAVVKQAVGIFVAPLRQHLLMHASIHAYCAGFPVRASLVQQTAADQSQAAWRSGRSSC